MEVTKESSTPESALWTPEARKFAAAQFVASLGDWIGLIAILSLSLRLTQGTPFEVFGPGMILLTRTVPGFLFGQLAGALVDRWDRRKVLVVCNVMRGLLIAMLPFLPNLALLILNQLLFEAMTMLWQPAKEASVPDVVPKEHISKMNSISQIAVYGTFPLGALLFAGIADLAEIVGRIPAFQIFEINQESLALFLNSATFFLSAYLLGGLHLKRHYAPKHALDLTLALRETREGYRAIGRNMRVRTVIAGMSAAIFGAGAVISLGPLYVREDLSGGASGFGLLVTALGVGAAVGVMSMETVGKKLRRVTIYPAALVTAGAALVLGAVVTTLPAAAALVFVAGLAAAPAYIAGLTLVHQEAEVTFRGRSFAAFLSLTRLAMMVALGAAPLVAGALGGLTASLLSGQRLTVGGVSIVLSGTRMALLLGGIVIMASGISTAAVFYGGGRERELELEAADSGRRDELGREERPELARPKVSVSDVDPFRVSMSMEARESEPSDVEGGIEVTSEEDSASNRRLHRF